MSKDLNSEVVIKVDGLYKKFSRNLRRSMAYGAIDLFRNFIGFPTYQGRLRKSEFWALEDINFELKKGETLGIIGVNGSGKSTLLRVLTGIFPPDRGKVYVNGKIGALIAVGAGFHPHLTGRENIYLNGTILGMTRDEIEQKYDDIVRFADIGEFLESPVSTYSSGMRVRLGFSIALHCEPDILLIDEILSVGDLSFRNKSLRKLAEMRKKAKGIIFISHNIEQVLDICDRVIVMNKGRISFNGDPQDAVIHYYNYVNDQEMLKQEAEEIQEGRTAEGEHIHSGDIDVLDIGILNASGEKSKQVAEGEDITVYTEFITHRLIRKPKISLSIRDERDTNMIWQNNRDERIDIPPLEPGKYIVKMQIKNPTLASNIYRVVFAFKELETTETIEKLALNEQNFQVTGNRVQRGVMFAQTEWSIDKSD